MTRIPLVAGNWKMNMTLAESRELVPGLLEGLADFQGVDVLVCPPFTALSVVAEVLSDSPISVGAQNMYWEESGAFTGEISPLMVAELCSHVILGHSERRAQFGDTDENVNRRVRAALAHSLIPILCVGETLQENEAGRTADVVSRQVRAGLEGIAAEEAGGIVVAYEPVWAIGTGRAATAEGANEVIAVIIRPALEHLFGEDIAKSTRILYGGSVSGENAAELFGQTDIDGGLVGGASLSHTNFLDIIRAAA
jgi:triosephosphate isomerase